MIHFEHTDTFGGEANYSWVRRHSFANLTPDLTDLQIVRRAKAWAGLTGIRCRVEHYGDMTAIYPSGICHVVFITYSDDPAPKVQS